MSRSTTVITCVDYGKQRELGGVAAPDPRRLQPRALPPSPSNSGICEPPSSRLLHTYRLPVSRASPSLFLLCSPCRNRRVQQPPARPPSWPTSLGPRPGRPPLLPRRPGCRPARSRPPAAAPPRSSLPPSSRAAARAGDSLLQPRPLAPRPTAHRPRLPAATHRARRPASPTAWTPLPLALAPPLLLLPLALREPPAAAARAPPQPPRARGCAPAADHSRARPASAAAARRLAVAPLPPCLPRPASPAGALLAALPLVQPRSPASPGHHAAAQLRPAVPPHFPGLPCGLLALAAGASPGHGLAPMPGREAQRRAAPTGACPLTRPSPLA
nr:proline-rich protein 36-like [Aegilops tauschii subsp. strangulata]